MFHFPLVSFLRRRHGRACNEGSCQRVQSGSSKDRGLRARLCWGLIKIQRQDKLDFYLSIEREKIVTWFFLDAWIHLKLIYSSKKSMNDILECMLTGTQSLWTSWGTTIIGLTIESVYFSYVKKYHKFQLYTDKVHVHPTPLNVMM